MRNKTLNGPANVTIYKIRVNSNIQLVTVPIHREKTDWGQKGKGVRICV